MSARVLKYPLGNDARVDIPDGARILHCGMQNETITIWALVDSLDEGGACTRAIHVRGTGHQIERPDRLSHIGTVFDGPFVWHVFEEIAA